VKNSVSKIGITAKFNIILFVFLCFVSTIDFIFTPESKKMTLWDELYNVAPIISIVLGVASIFLAIFFGAKFVQIFWNRFISDIFSLRSISLQEGIAVVLMTGFFAI